MDTEGQRKGWGGRGWRPLVWEAVSGGKQGTRQNGTDIEGRAHKSSGECCVVKRKRWQMRDVGVINGVGVGRVWAGSDGREMETVKVRAGRGGEVAP